MHKKELCLTPIPCKLPPPKNTQIQVRCFTCKKFDVCRIKEDYLKTAMLISDVLGCPAENYELNWIPNFNGTDVQEPLNYFPAKIKITDGTNVITCDFLGARYMDCDNVSFVYYNNDIVALFKVIYDTETEKWQFFMGQNVCNGLPYYIMEEDTATIEQGLIQLRIDLLNPKPTCTCDIIDTTAFSARLECDHYDPIKELSYCEGMRQIAERYPKGVPLGCGKYYHIATFHIEPYEVPCYHPFNGVTAYMPMPYPVMIPSKCNKKCERTHRRDDNGKLQ